MYALPCSRPESKMRGTTPTRPWDVVGASDSRRFTSRRRRGVSRRACSRRHRRWVRSRPCACPRQVGCRRRRLGQSVLAGLAWPLQARPHQACGQSRHKDSAKRDKAQYYCVSSAVMRAHARVCRRTTSAGGFPWKTGLACLPLHCVYSSPVLFAERLASGERLVEKGTLAEADSVVGNPAFILAFGVSSGTLAGRSCCSAGAVGRWGLSLEDPFRSFSTGTVR